MAVTYADAEKALADWVNAQTADLVGTGKPLTKGALLNRMRGAAQVCYLYVSQVGGSHAFGAESPDLRARMGGQVFGPNKESAARAATAYAEALTAKLAGTSYTVAGVATILVADNITGPLWAPDRDEPRYLVDVDLYLRPV